MKLWCINQNTGEYLPEDCHGTQIFYKTYKHKTTRTKGFETRIQTWKCQTRHITLFNSLRDTQGIKYCRRPLHQNNLVRSYQKVMKHSGGYFFINLDVDASDPLRKQSELIGYRRVYSYLVWFTIFCTKKAGT